MYEDMGRAMIIMAVLSIIAVPLIIYELVMLILWLISHVKII